MNPIIVATSGGSGIGTGVSTALSFVWDSFSSTIGTFNEYPVLWVGCALGIAGALIGLVKRAVKVGGRRR